MPSKAALPIPRKVVLAIGTLGTGGAEKQLAALAKDLVRSDVQVTVLLLSGWSARADELVQQGVNVLSLLSDGERPVTAFGYARSTFLAIRRAGRFIRVWRPEVVHAWMLHAFVLLLPIAWVLRVPVRLQARRSMRAGIRDRWWLRSGLRFARLFSTAITVNSRAILHEVVVQEGVDASVVRYVPNSVELPSEAVIADPTRQPASGVLVARFVVEKAHETLLQALALMPERPRIVLVGDGPVLDEMKALATTLGVLASVEFVGGTPEATEFQLAAQFAVLCSRTEGLPNVILEAMALGLPTVATDVGGVRELVVDGVTGLLVPPENPVALAAALERMAADPDMRQEMGRRAREAVIASTGDEIARQYLEFYAEQLRGRRRVKGGRA